MKKGFFAKKRNKIIIAVALLALAAFLFFGKFFNNQPSFEYSTTTVIKTSLSQTVNEIGMVKADEEVKMSFPFGGQLEAKFFSMGDRVKAGDVLAELNNKSLLIQKQQAEAGLDSARANLQKLISGATFSELAVLEAQSKEVQRAHESALINLEKIKKTAAEDIRQAEKSLHDLSDSGPDTLTVQEQAVASAKSNLEKTKSSHQKAIDNSIDNTLTDIGAKLPVANTALDNADTIIKNDDYKDKLGVRNRVVLETAKSDYLIAKSFSISANNSLFEALGDKSETRVKKAAVDALAYLNKTADVLKNLYFALEASTMSDSILSGLKNNVSAQMSYVNTSISLVQGDKQALDGAYISYDSNVSAAENNLRSAEVSLSNAITSAKNALLSVKLLGEQRISSAESQVRTSKESLEVIKSQLAKIKSPARNEDVSLVNAQVSQAQSSLDLINKQIQDSYLKSPLDGMVIRNNFERGEQIQPSQVVFSILGDNNYKIEVDISESDIAKIKKDDKAMVTLDAFGSGHEFLAYVHFIEPAQTIIQDVVYYKVVLKFSDSPEKLSQVKPGMTANVSIITAEKEDVLVAPERAIIEKAGGERIIRLLRDASLLESPVKTGLRGDGGLLEIISGASAGDEAVVFVREKK